MQAERLPSIGYIWIWSMANYCHFQRLLHFETCHRDYRGDEYLLRVEKAQSPPNLSGSNQSAPDIQTEKSSGSSWPGPVTDSIPAPGQRPLA